MHIKYYVKEAFLQGQSTRAEDRTVLPRSCVMQKDDEAGQLGTKIGRDQG